MICHICYNAARISFLLGQVFLKRGAIIIGDQSLPRKHFHLPTRWLCRQMPREATSMRIRRTPLHAGLLATSADTLDIVPCDKYFLLALLSVLSFTLTVYCLFRLTTKSIDIDKQQPKERKPTPSNMLLRTLAAAIAFAASSQAFAFSRPPLAVGLSIARGAKHYRQPRALRRVPSRRSVDRCPFSRPSTRRHPGRPPPPGTS